MDVLAMIKNDYPKFSLFDYNSGIKELNSCLNLFYLIVHDYENNNYAEKTEVRVYIKKAIEFVLEEENAPSFDNGHNWGYPILAQILALIKNKEDLWNLFDIKTHKKMDLAMKMFSFMWNFGCNKFNNYKTGIGLHGNFTKVNSPNYALSNNILIIWCIEYFGGLLSNVSRKFVETEYDDLINELEENEFKNAYYTWTTKRI